MLESLTCQTCARGWWRTFRRGTKPRRCPPCDRLWRNGFRRRSGYRPPSTAKAMTLCACGAAIPTDYRTHGGGSQRRRCADCQLEKQRLKWRRSLCRKHGITVERFEQLLERQNGTCAVPGCSRTDDGRGRSLHIDHDHSCCPGEHSCGACVRGLLCARHNIGVGYFADDPLDLEAAASYLRSRRS